VGGAAGEKAARGDGPVATAPGACAVAVVGDGSARAWETVWPDGPRAASSWGGPYRGSVLGPVTSSKYSKYFPNYFSCSKFKNTKHYIPDVKIFSTFGR
jgi:hypothetical protein